MNEPKRSRGQPPKPAELKKQNVTIKLSPEIIARLKQEPNKSRLIEKLLVQHFNIEFGHGKPDKPGYYWCHNIKDGFWIVNIKQENGQLIVYEQGEENGWLIDIYNKYYGAAWWCEIKEPAEF